MSKEVKTNEEKIEKIYNICENHFGGVRAVSVKFNKKWKVKVQFDYKCFNSLTAEGKTLDEALEILKDNIKKIIRRYNFV